MEWIQSKDKLYLFKFFDIKPNPTHLKIGKQIVQYISCVCKILCQLKVNLPRNSSLKFYLQITCDNP